MSLNTLASHRTYTGETFKKVNFTRELVTEATFTECKFTRCDFTETTFRICRLMECEFDDCTLRLIKIPDTTLSQVKFSKCNLMGVNWTEANWSGWATRMSAVEFENCVLEYGSFLGLELKKLKLKNSNAREANFSETDLTEADFAGTDLAGAIFLKTTLTKANFVGAKNYTLSVIDNKAKGARFALPEAVRLLYALPVVMVDPATNQEITEDDLNDPSF
jgi:fluoroquinolone resistance protein